MLGQGLAVVIILTGVYLVWRRLDVRLVLGLCSIVLFSFAGKLPAMFVVMAREMANEKTVVPICTAMGFAHVVQHTGCDQHLVHLLTRPLVRARTLLIPGGIAIAYLVNTAIVSQSSTAATVGPVLVPLLLSAGISAPTAGALLLLGASMGGELFNPGAVEVLTLSSLSSLSPQQVVRRMMPINLLSSASALLVFWLLAARRERRHEAAPEEERAPPAGLRVSPIKAALPLVPLLLLFLVPAFFRLPQELSGSVTIGAAMFTGAFVVGIACPQRARELPQAFFEGAGWAYAQVISLIVIATLFTEGIKHNGLIEGLAHALAGRPALSVAGSIAVPSALSAASGSGIAPAVAVMKVLVPMSEALGLDGARLGCLTSVAAHLGRTMSPAAAVVMMSATVARVPPMELVKRVAPALACAALILLIAALLSVV